MGTGSRLGLLLAVAISVLGSYPPSKPPGDRQPSDFKTATCPGCKRKIAEKVGARFHCQHCNRYFTLEEANRPGTG